MATPSNPERLDQQPLDRYLAGTLQRLHSAQPGSDTTPLPLRSSRQSFVFRSNRDIWMDDGAVPVRWLTIRRVPRKLKVSLSWRVGSREGRLATRFLRPTSR